MPEAPDSRRSAVRPWSRPTTPKQPTTNGRRRRLACTRQAWTPQDDRRVDRLIDLVILALIGGVLAALIVPPALARWFGGMP